MRLFVAHAGKVLTHRFILREVWGGEGDVQYLRVYIRALRHKIEAEPGAAALHSDRAGGRLPHARPGLIAPPTLDSQEGCAAVDITDLIAPECVIAAMRVGDKSQLLRELSQRAAKLLAIDPQSILDALRAREALGSTGVGQGIALPHARVAGLERVLRAVCAVGATDRLSTRSTSGRSIWCSCC